jgi:hypothetical protein
MCFAIHCRNFGYFSFASVLLNIVLSVVVVMVIVQYNISSWLFSAVRIFYVTVRTNVHLVVSTCVFHEHKAVSNSFADLFFVVVYEYLPVDTLELS